MDESKDDFGLGFKLILNPNEKVIQKCFVFKSFSTTSYFGTEAFLYLTNQRLFIYGVSTPLLLLTPGAKYELVWAVELEKIKKIEIGSSWGYPTGIIDEIKLTGQNRTDLKQLLNEAQNLRNKKLLDIENESKRIQQIQQTQQNNEKEDRRTLIQRIKEAESFGLMPPQIIGAVQLPDALLYPDEVIAVTSQLDEFLNTARPQINLSILFKQVTLDSWKKERISVTNKGSAHAKDVSFEFSNDLEVRHIKTMDILAGETKQFEIPIKAKVKGTIPLDITVTYRDAREKPYSDTFDFDIEGIENVTTAPSPVDGFTPKPFTLKQLPPDLADGYTESEFIGKGGFARVFKAKRKDGRYVAVKIPISMDAVTGKSFIAEMQNWTKLSHPNIVKLYDFNIMPMPYFEEELCDSALADQNKPIESEDAAWILFNVCEGLKFAHARKIIHRDLKPQNILLKEGVPKISDWGLSRIVSESTSTTATSFTPYYAAPEQINNRAKDERTDIWQTGVILYELMTGVLPFKGESMIEIGMNIATKDPTPPGELIPDVKVIDGVVMKCLQKDPAQRYQSVLELQKDLALYLRKNYAELLKTSVSVQDYNKSASYCGDLVMINMNTGDIPTAYKFLLDLVKYSKGDVKVEAQELSEQIKMRIEMGVTEIPDELIQKAEIIVHQVSSEARKK